MKKENDLVNIIELVNDAVRTYPAKFNNYYDFFKEIKLRIGKNLIVKEDLIIYLENNTLDINENDNIWIIDAFNSLIDAYDIASMKGIDIEELFRNKNIYE